MKKFIEEFKKSFTSKEWYKDILDGNVHFNLGYTAKLALISSIVLTVFFTIFLYKDLIPNSKALILEFVPGDLILTLKSGQLSINKPVPYALPLPENSDVHKNKKNLLVIDTSAEANLQSTKTYDTVLFANKDGLITEKDRNEIRAYSFKDFPDSTITREKIIDLFEMVSGQAWLLSIFVLVLLTLVFLLQMLITFLIAATLLWITLKIAKRSTHWKNTFTAVAYAYTIVFTANLILTLLTMPTFRFGHGIVITTIIAAVFVLMHKKEAPMSPQNPTI